MLIFTTRLALCLCLCLGLVNAAAIDYDDYRGGNQYGNDYRKDNGKYAKEYGNDYGREYKKEYGSGYGKDYGNYYGNDYGNDYKTKEVPAKVSYQEVKVEEYNKYGKPRVVDRYYKYNNQAEY